MAKESIVIFPIALLMSFYGSVRYASLDLSAQDIAAVAVLLTLAMSAYFARKSPRRPPTLPQSPAQVSSEPIEPK
ncbi:hypothetical protein [Granulicella rosea]|nr:hypothetical protein [Granulicella rosea]